MSVANYTKDKNGRFVIGSGADAIESLPAGMYTLDASPFEVRLSPCKDEGFDKLDDVPGSPADVIVADVAQFFAGKDKFAALGLTHKRGYLMHGPPGTGKTCTSRLVARRLIAEQNAVVVDGSVQVAAFCLKRMNAVEPGRLNVFLVEEIDEQIESGLEPELLKLLDGTTGTNFVVLATTNDPKKLPARVIKRPGRFDRVVDVSEFPEASRVSYFTGKVADVPACVAATAGLPISAWREIVVRASVYGDDPAEVGAQLRTWLLAEAAADE